LKVRRFEGGVISTLLTQGYEPPTHDEIKHRQIADEALGAARVILESIIHAYAEGELTIETAVRQATTAIQAERIPRDFQRQKMLGAFVSHVCEITPKPRNRKSSRKYPAWIRQTAIDLLEIVVEKEKLPKERIAKNGMTAYERVAGILDMRGVAVSAYDVERFYTNQKRKTQ
jgi:hypothetical protein